MNDDMSRFLFRFFFVFMPFFLSVSRNWEVFAIYPYRLRIVRWLGEEGSAGAGLGERGSSQDFMGLIDGKIFFFFFLFFSTCFMAIKRFLTLIGRLNIICYYTYIFMTITSPCTNIMINYSRALTW